MFTRTHRNSRELTLRGVLFWLVMGTSQAGSNRSSSLSEEPEQAEPISKKLEPRLEPSKTLLIIEKAQSLEVYMRIYPHYSSCIQTLYADLL